MKRPSALIIALVCLTGCQHLQESKNASALPNTVPIETKPNYIKERLIVEQWTASNDINADESPIALLAAPVIGSAVKAGLKFLAKKGGDALESYAQQFGSTYSATESFGNFGATGRGSERYWFVFRRTLIFSNTNEIAKALGNLAAPDSIRISGTNSFEVDAVVVPFILETTQTKRTSWRFVDISLIKRFPTNLVKMQDPNQTGQDTYPQAVEIRALKGRVLDSSGRLDNFKATISVAIRESGNFGGKVETRVTDPAILELSSKQLSSIPNGVIRNVGLSSDWLPCPSGEAFSIKVQVVESSRTKEWIEKAAKKLVSAAEKSIDELE